MGEADSSTGTDDTEPRPHRQGFFYARYGLNGGPNSVSHAKRNACERNYRRPGIDGDLEEALSVYPDRPGNRRTPLACLNRERESID